MFFDLLKMTIIFYFHKIYYVLLAYKVLGIAFLLTILELGFEGWGNETRIINVKGFDISLKMNLGSFLQYLTNLLYSKNF
jgi:hypothetical protein